MGVARALLELLLEELLEEVELELEHHPRPLAQCLV
jgi:hypothetical protein